MEIIKYPERSAWEQLLKRPVMNSRELEASVSAIINEVKSFGDDALLKICKLPKQKFQKPRKK